MAVLITLFAGHAAFDGATLAVREYAREQAGHVTMGVVVNKLSSTGAERFRQDSRTAMAPFTSIPRDRRLRPSRRDRPRHSDRLAERLGDRVSRTPATHRTDAPAATSCRKRSGGGCTSIRTSTSVRRESETRSARLDENPQRATAAVQLSLAALLLLVAAVVSGRLTALRPRGYLTAPAVVTAVEPVTYRDDAKRWRVRFAYFDPHGAPQESADEVATAGWKPGDGCVAVFRPERPDVATFRPRPAA